MDSTSPTLLDRVKNARDARAWEEFFRLYYPLITKYARTRGLRVVDAEEVAQECMRALATHMRRFDYSRSRGRFRGYVRKIADNKIADLFRRKQPRQAKAGELSGLPAHTDAAAEWDSLWLRQHLRHCISKLSTAYAGQTVAAFRLYALEGWPVEEVCAKLGMTANQVYLAKTRLIRRLREEVSQAIGDVW